MNKVLKKALLLFAFFFAGYLKLYPAVIEGFGPAYAGRTLSFYKYSDPILKNNIGVFDLEVDDKGYFREEVNLTGTVFCLSDFDVYRVMLIVEPQSSLKIKLPPLRKKSLPESKNPYFKPVVLWLQVDSGNNSEINRIVSDIEQRFNQLTSKYFNQLYLQNSSAYIDTVKLSLQNEFAKSIQPIAKTQVLLKIKILEADIKPERHPDIFKNFSIPENFYTNPAFIGLFDLLFSNKLSFEANSVKAAELNKAVGANNIGFIKDYFSKKFNLDSGLTDYVLLKVLHDGYYSNQFPKNKIITMLESPAFSGNPNPGIKKIAGGIVQKLHFLSPGSVAPVICLGGLDGQQQCSDQLKGYRYIIFADTEMLVCREHLKYLATIREKFKGQPGIFIVARNSDLDKIREFFSRNDVPGIKVVETPSNQFAAEFKVRSYPSAFLLNEKNEVLLSPAKNPLDGFETEFASLLRNAQMEKFRNQR